ncbi:MAG: glycosyltransferase [Chloroflexota bacterium]|nr:glycosyltransferase [Chloroflexota bacterium]MDE2908004.1 glycosyltransferase [Chloroflexota bacterium]
MATFWFVSAPLYSHTDWGGFLKTAQVLKAHGHEILWLSEAPLENAIRRSGVPFVSLRETGWLWPPPAPPDLSQIAPQEAISLRYRRALNTWLSEELVADAVEAMLDLEDEIGAPDAIVSDPFLSASAITADILDVPLVICGWPAQTTLDEQRLFPVQRDLSSDSQQRIQRLCDRFRVEGRNFSKGAAPSIRSELLHIVYFTPEWYQTELPTILPQTQFVGGRAEAPDDPPPQWLLDIPPETPLGLVTLGTSFTGDLGFYSWAAQAVASAGMIPLVTIGWNPIAPERKAELKRALPAGTRLLNWAPYDHVLPRCRIAIHHGGVGTTHAAVAHGLPQIVAPHAADQRIQGRRAAEAKVGLNLTARDVRQGQLREGVHAIMEADWVRENARRLAAEMAGLGGVERAGELVAGVVG